MSCVRNGLMVPNHANMKRLIGRVQEGSISDG